MKSCRLGLVLVLLASFPCAAPAAAADTPAAVYERARAVCADRARTLDTAQARYRARPAKGTAARLARAGREYDKARQEMERARLAASRPGRVANTIDRARDTLAARERSYERAAGRWLARRTPAARGSLERAGLAVAAARAALAAAERERR